MTLHRDVWLSLLQRPFPDEERARFAERVAQLDARIDAIQTAPAVDAATLARARLVGSRSLKAERDQPRDAEALRGWLAANEWLTQSIAHGRALDDAALATLNARLLGAAGATAFRTTPVFLGAYSCPPPEDVTPLMAPMFAAVAARAKDVHPIAAAALLEQWIVSVHPFADANGRTSRLAADWWLAEAGYPPASYPDVLSSLTAIVDHGREPIGVGETALVLVSGIEHTLSLLAP